MAEINDKGYVVKNQNEWFDEETQLYVDIDPNWNLDPSTPDGLKIAHDAEIFGNLDELGQQAYNSKDPNKARGIELDIISAITGTFRDLGTPSTTTLDLGGVTGTVVTAGSLVSDINNVEWSIDSEVTLPASVSATCTIIGATQADPNSITDIVSTIGGWESVTNPTVATPGTNQQTDAQLRLSRALQVGRPGNNQIDSMLGEIGAVDGVRRFKIYENDKNITDSDGLPPHSIAPVVDGGLDDDVALAIYLKKNPGVLLHPAGTPVTVTVQSPEFPANTKDITFSRPLYVDINFEVEITDDGTLPSNVDELVTEAILSYTQGGLIASECGFNVQGFDIGEDVPLSRMFTPINQVIGQYGNSYVSELLLNGATANIAIAFNELSRFTEANITVTVV